MSENTKINWYRCKVDKAVMSELMKSSDWLGLRQCLLQLGLFVLTTALTYAAWLHIDQANWPWMIPVFLVALFIHGTLSSFLGLGGPGHELSHKTPFKSKAMNEFFLKVYGFIAWTDVVGFRPSHVKHHQVTVHHDLDGEVVLPQKIDFRDWKFLVWIFGFNFPAAYNNIKDFVKRSFGIIDFPWYQKVMPEENVKLRQEHKNWARFVLTGQIILAVAFVATGNWPLVFLVNFGNYWFGWLTVLCGMPQHMGMQPDVPDFRRCCRTYTCSWLPAFLYWNMQYHVEHHMYPAVPFYNLPKLRKAMEHDLPPATHGLWATWREIFQTLEKQKADPNYFHAPPIPSGENGERVDDELLQSEAAARA